MSTFNQPISIRVPASSTEQIVNINVAMDISSVYNTTGGTPIVPANQPPTVYAGNDISITLPINSINLIGTASDSDGTIKSTLWAQVSGPSSVILTPTANATSVTNLSIGTYVFAFVVTDNAGATSIDNINVIVNPAVIPPTPTRQNLIYEGTYEQSYPFSGMSLETTNSNGIRRSSEIALKGGYACRFQVSSMDLEFDGSIRSMINRGPKSEPGLNIERWYGFGVFLPKGYKADEAPDIISMFGTSLYLQIINNSYVITSLYENFIGNIADLGPIKAGVWAKFVFHIKWDQDGTHGGLIEVWQDGIKVVSGISGKNMGAGADDNIIWKWGVDKWSWAEGDPSSTTDRVLYFDEVREGNELATYNDVAP